MIRILNKKKLSAIFLASLMVMTSTGATTFAASNTSSAKQPVKTNQKVQINAAQLTSVYKTALDSLVTKGTITQAQSDAISKALPAKGTAPGGKAGFKNPLESLVSAGTITSDQLKAIETALKTARESGKDISDVLAGLVTKGTCHIYTSDAADE